MTLYFNPPKDGDKFATIGGSLENVNTQLVFTEARIQKSDDGAYKLFMMLHEASDLAAVGDKNWKFSPCLTSIILRSEEYERNKKDNDGNWTKVKTQPTEVEKFFAELFEADAELFLNEEKAFKGSINLWDNAQTFAAIRTGKQPNGTDIPQSGLDFIKLGMINCESCDIDLLKDLPSPSNGKKGWSGSKGQTEAEKLKERRAAVIDFMNEMGMSTTNPFEDLQQVHAYLSLYSEDAETQANTATNLLRILMG